MADVGFAGGAGREDRGARGRVDTGDVIPKVPSVSESDSSNGFTLYAPACGRRLDPIGRGSIRENVRL
jgi:hypothetical protein